MLITVTLMLTVPTPLVASPVPVTWATVEMALAVLVSASSWTVGELTTSDPSEQRIPYHKVPLSPAVLPPSSPSLVSVTPRTTCITLVWTQPAGEVVDSYLITYSFTVTGCPGVDGNSMVTVSGSSSNHTLTGLEENSVVTISILARNGAGDSQAVGTTTSTFIAGREVMSTAVLIYHCTP